MDNIGGVIWIILIIAFTVFRNAQKSAKKQQQQQNKYTGNVPNAKSSAAKTTLQSQLNNALKQINEIKDMAQEQYKASTQQSKPAQTNRPQNRAYNSSLEGHQMEGHIVEGHKVEGHKVEGHVVEGHKVEGIAHRHNTKKYNKDRRVAVTESSMKRGYAGEGCDEHYDLELAYTKPSRGREKGSLHFSDNPIVQGLVMSQILERPKRRY